MLDALPLYVLHNLEQIDVGRFQEQNTIQYIYCVNYKIKLRLKHLHTLTYINTYITLYIDVHIFAIYNSKTILKLNEHWWLIV